MPRVGQPREPHIVHVERYRFPAIEVDAAHRPIGAGRQHIVPKMRMHRVPHGVVAAADGRHDRVRGGEALTGCQHDLARVEPRAYLDGRPIGISLNDRFMITTPRKVERDASPLSSTEAPPMRNQPVRAAKTGSATARFAAATARRDGGGVLLHLPRPAPAKARGMRRPAR